MEVSTVPWYWEGTEGQCKNGWLQTLAEGIEGMVKLGVSTGRKRAISDRAVSSLEKQLEETDGKFQSYTQIQQGVNAKINITYIGIKPVWYRSMYWLRIPPEKKYQKTPSGMITLVP